MNSQQRKQAARKEMIEGSPKFTEIDLSKANKMPPNMTRAFRNNRFIVMIFDNAKSTHGPVCQVLIQSHFNKPIENHWATIQQIKNEVFGKEVVAIEYFPAESQLIDHHNIYWIWIFPDGVLPMPSV
jgi:hypothetical protein